VAAAIITCPWCGDEIRFISRHTAAQDLGHHLAEECVSPADDGAPEADGAVFAPVVSDAFGHVPANEYGPWDYARASLVRYAYPGNGWPDDRERAAELLTPGDVYAVSRCTVGDSVTRLELMGKPGSFNSVLFEPVPDEEAGQ